MYRFVNLINLRGYNQYCFPKLKIIKVGFKDYKIYHYFETEPQPCMLWRLTGLDNGNHSVVLFRVKMQLTSQTIYHARYPLS